MDFDTPQPSLWLMMLWLAVIIVFGLFILDTQKVVSNLMFINCCNGSFCSDTYYTVNDNICHLVLCENNIFAKNCTYPGNGITRGSIEFSCRVDCCNIPGISSIDNHSYYDINKTCYNACMRGVL